MNSTKLVLLVGIFALFGAVVVVEGKDLDEFTILKAYCQIMKGSDIYVEFRLQKQCHSNARIFDKTVRYNAITVLTVKTL